MKEKKRILITVSGAVFAPPLAWLFLNYYVGIFVNVGELLAIAFSPRIWSYVAVYFGLLMLLTQLRLRPLFAWNLNDPASVVRAQAAVRALPRDFLVAMFFYPVIGAPLVLFRIDFIDPTEFWLGFLIGPTVIFLCTVPFFIRLLSQLDALSADLPLSRERGSLGLHVKLTLVVTVTILGGALSLLVAELAILRSASLDAAGAFDAALEKSLVVSALLISISIYNTTLLARHLRAPLRYLSDVVVRLADYDMTPEIRVVSRDESGHVIEAFRRMQGILLEVLGSLSRSAASVAERSSSIASVVSDLANHTRAQAGAAGETNGATEEIAAAVEEIAGQTESQTISVAEIVSIVDEWRASIEDLGKKAAAIRQEATDSAGRAEEARDFSRASMQGMDRITASAQEISGVVEAIDSIADRTNLLALNASIEAARAGAEGRGFAVVAHEISRLADQSAESTRSIGQLIAHATESAGEGVALARQVDEAVARMKATADHSALLAGQMAARIEEQMQFRERIERAARNLNLMSAQIHGATREHSNLTLEIHRGVENLFGSAQKTSSVSEQVLGETAELSAEAARLHALLKRFKLPG